MNFVNVKYRNRILEKGKEESPVENRKHSIGKLNVKDDSRQHGNDANPSQTGGVVVRVWSLESGVSDESPLPIKYLDFGNLLSGKSVSPLAQKGHPNYRNEQEILESHRLAGRLWPSHSNPNGPDLCRITPLTRGLIIGKISHRIHHLILEPSCRICDLHDLSQCCGICTCPP
jgi:hypothetical protein